MSDVPVAPVAAACGCPLVLRPCRSCGLEDYLSPIDCDHDVRQPVECPTCEANWSAG
jgi:predicted Zn-ribbon and HTH transcriptional regulator